MKKNVSLEKLSAFKSKFFKNLEPMHYIIKQAFPNLEEYDVISFIQAQYYFSVGILPVADPDDIQRKALELSGADYVVPDFYNELYNHLNIYLTGLLKSKPI